MSSRENQRTSSSSVVSMTISSVSASPDAADHQRGWKRPGLRRKITHGADADARLLEGLAADRILDRFAGLEESREARIGPGLKPRLPAEQALLAPRDQHDHDGIGAGKMLRFASRAIAAEARMRHHGAGAAIGAEAVARMPVQHRFGHGQKAKLAFGNEARHGDGAQIRYDEGRVVAKEVGCLRRSRRWRPRGDRPGCRGKPAPRGLGGRSRTEVGNRQVPGCPQRGSARRPPPERRRRRDLAYGVRALPGPARRCGGRGNS